MHYPEKRLSATRTNSRYHMNVFNPPIQRPCSLCLLPTTLILDCGNQDYMPKETQCKTIVYTVSIYSYFCRTETINILAVISFEYWTFVLSGKSINLINIIQTNSMMYIIRAGKRQLRARVQKIFTDPLHNIQIAGSGVLNIFE